MTASPLAESRFPVGSSARRIEGSPARVRAVRIWLQKATDAYPELYEWLKRQQNDAAKPQAQRFPDCYVPAHSAKITCDKGDCAYIFGLDKPELNRVASFAKVVDGSGQKYPEDAAEYWKCKCQ